MKMKWTKSLFGFTMLVTILGLVFGQSMTFAAKTDSFWVGLSEMRTNNTPNSGYGIGDPTSGANAGKYIWDLNSYSAETGGSSTNRTLYCVKGGVGHTWNTNVNSRVNYKTGYDLKTEKDEINTNIPDTQSVYKEIIGSNYNQILWVSDNMYIPGESSAEDRTALLKAAGIVYGKEPFRLFDENDNPIDYPEELRITDDDIEVVQQMALWYFTNSDAYHVDTLNTININNSNVSGYTPMSTYLQVREIGPERLKQMNRLYNYLIEKNVTDKNSSKYDATSNELGAPVTVTSDVISVANGKVGPFTVTKVNSLPYTLSFSVNGTEVTDANNFVDANGNKIDKDSYVGDIYIKVSQTSNIQVTGKINYKTTETTLWVPGNSNIEQPIIEVKKAPKEVDFSFSTEGPGNFDLSLRKFITAISSDSTFEDGDYITNNGKSTGTYTRAPQVDVTPLKNGETTASYVHTKEPLKVKTGDYIEYTIRVYNEGELDGYAEEITDYILNNRGLEFAQGHATNTTYGWTKSGNKVTTDYLSKSKETGSNQTILTAFDKNTGTTLSSRDVKIVFKVTEPNSSNDDIVLVNIAEISKAKDKDGNDMNVEGKDRDSTPNQDQYNYPNNGYTSTQHEDDIDYEPLKLKKFDLSLQKFISAVTSDENGTFSESDYLTGANSREPKLDGNWTGTTLNKSHPTDAVSVKSGDYVLYTIRIYNEGEIDGYASEITDNIPAGLEYVTNHPINANNYWSVKTVESNNHVSAVTTDSLDKGKGKELNATEGDANYNANLLKAFDKASAVSSSNPDYRDVQIVLKVTEPDTSTRTLVNYGQISKAKDNDGNDMNDQGDDVDSTPDNGYSYNEDDEDLDRVVLQVFDLSLRKFITAVKTNGTTSYLTDTGNSGEAGSDGTYTRAPQVDTTSLKEGTTATYNHSKTPVVVQNGSTVIYAIRVYNEGTVDGYASEITDFLPQELEMVEPGTGEGQSKINQDNGWTVVDGSNGRIVKTSKLANSVLTARTENAGNASNPYTLKYETVEIECKVKESVQIDQKITNIAEITKYGDKNKQEVSTDIDSKANSLTDGDSSTGTLPEDSDLPTYKDNETGIYIPGQQDDDDFEKIIISKKIDLALTKFITAISNDEKIEDGEYLTADKTSQNAGSSENPYTRQTAVNTNPLKQGEHDAIYTQVKTPLVVGSNSYVLYNIRVYNEGEVDVYAGEVTDYLPEYLTFVEGEFNTSYGWTANGQTVKTTHLSSTNGTNNILKAFDKETDDGAGSGLDYKDLPILCRVNSTAPSGKELINTAEITKYLDKDGNELDKDIDSTPDNKQTKNDKTREEDDDDFEVIILKKVDIALTKFITAVSDDEKIEDGEYLTADKTSKNAGSSENPYTRQTEVNTNPLKQGEHDAEYTQVKTPLNVNRGAFVLYNIRVYNEGETDVYAGEVTDYLPENLSFVDGEFNQKYGWTANGQTVKTTHLSSINGTDNMLKAFNKDTDNGAGSGLDYRDLAILCRVSDKTPSAKELINTAEITKYEDENGKDLPNDIDSTPDNVDKKNEDDDDYDVVIVEEFDLSLIKFVSQVVVNEDGKTSTTNTGNTGNKDTDIIPKVEINKKKINSTTVKFVYTIIVSNEGDIAGYAKEVTDYIPEGLEFKAEDNPNWTVKSDGSIATKALAETLLQPGQSAPVTVTFTWINGATNLGLKRNWAEISEDYNDKNVPDRDSVPDNRVEKEDDIDYADVLLSIKTGAVQTYILLGGSILLVLASGIILIKKYVL